MSTLEKPGGIRPMRVLALLLVVVAIELLSRIIDNIPVTVVQAAYSLIIAGMMTAFLAWLVPKIRLSRWQLTALVWLELFVVGYLNNYIEGYFFTSMLGGRMFVERLGSSLLYSLIVAAAATLLLGYRFSPAGLASSLRQHLSTKTKRSWVLRMVAGSVVYFPIYFFFGILVSPFVVPYYNNPSSGLRIPSFAVIVPVELFRGFVYTIVLLPLLAVLSGGRGTKFIALATTLYIPGALIPLLGNSLLPAPIIPFHALELLADSIVYGFVLSHILCRPG